MKKQPKGKRKPNKGRRPTKTRTKKPPRKSGLRKQRGIPKPFDTSGFPGDDQ